MATLKGAVNHWPLSDGVIAIWLPHSDMNE
jgi:hypothetical protein